MATDPSGERVDGGPVARRGARANARKAPPRRRRKARMVHRVVRHVEVWSVVKLATAFAACGYVIGMISGYLLWRAADRVGTIDGIEGFMEDSGGYDSFELVGDVVFTSAVGAFAVLAVLFVALAALGALLFNLISDLTGGIRMTAIDEDLIVTPARRPAPNREPRPGPARPEPTSGTTAVRGDDQEPAPDARTPAAERPTAPQTPAAEPAPPHDPWKTPAPNEPWTPTEPAVTNGHGAPSPVGSSSSSASSTEATRPEPTGPR